MTGAISPKTESLRITPRTGLERIVKRSTEADSSYEEQNQHLRSEYSLNSGYVAAIDAHFYRAREDGGYRRMITRKILKNAKRANVDSFSNWGDIIPDIKVEDANFDDSPLPITTVSELDKVQKPGTVDSGSARALYRGHSILVLDKSQRYGPVLASAEALDLGFQKSKDKGRIPSASVAHEIMHFHSLASPFDIAMAKIGKEHPEISHKDTKVGKEKVFKLLKKNITWDEYKELTEQHKLYTQVLRESPAYMLFSEVLSGVAEAHIGNRTTSKTQSGRLIRAYSGLLDKYDDVASSSDPNSFNFSVDITRKCYALYELMDNPTEMSLLFKNFFIKQRSASGEYSAVNARELLDRLDYEISQRAKPGEDDVKLVHRANKRIIERNEKTENVLMQTIYDVNKGTSIDRITGMTATERLEAFMSQKKTEIKERKDKAQKSVKGVKEGLISLAGRLPQLKRDR